jgi:hypothetical protein
LLGAGVYSFQAVCQSFSSHFIVVFNPHQTINEAQIYFIFLSVGQNGFAKVGWKGGSSFASLWFERWHVGACKCAYDCGVAINYFHISLTI